MTYLKNNELYGMEFYIKVPSEIRVNDLVISKNLLSGTIGPEIINQYIIKSGEQRVSIEVFHPYLDEGGLLDNSALKSILNGTFIQTVDPSNDYEVHNVKTLVFPEIKNKVPRFNYTWTFKADVPYKIMSWEDAQDLLKIEKDELKKQVVEKFKQLWNLLQTGNIDKFMQEIENANNDLFMSNYFDNERQNEYIINLREFYSDHKGAMQPMDNFNLVILADGKGVALEQVGNYKGFGLLLAESKITNSLFTNYITLIKSKETNAFRIQLINSELIRL